MIRPCSCSVVVPGAAVVLLVAGPAFGQDGILPAPRQVEAVVRHLGQDDTPQRLALPRVVVDLGTAHDRRWPDRDRPTRMTLIGTNGVMTAQLEEVVKVCETLCGNEAEECHYEGHLVPVGSLDTIGTPVAALPAEVALSEFASLAPTSPRTALDADELAETFTMPIWPEDNPAETRHRFSRTGGEFTLEYAWGTTGGQSVPAGQCEFYERGPLIRMACAGVEALIAETLPILVSFPDYNAAGVDLVASFAYAGRTYHVVRLALKVQTVFGLLFRDRDGWHARFHPRDYSLLC